MRHLQWYGAVLDLGDMASLRGEANPGEAKGHTSASLCRANWVGTAVLHNTGNCAVVFRVRPVPAPSDAAAAGLGGAALAALAGPGAPLPGLPSLAPDFSALAPGQSCRVRFNLLGPDALTLRTALVGPTPPYAEAYEKAYERPASRPTAGGGSGGGGGDGSNGGHGHEFEVAEQALWAARCEGVLAWAASHAASALYEVRGEEAKRMAMTSTRGGMTLVASDAKAGDKHPIQCFLS